MRKAILLCSILVLYTGSMVLASNRTILMNTNAKPVVLDNSAHFVCIADGKWKKPLRSAKISIWNASGKRLLDSADMQLSGLTASYDFTIPASETAGLFEFTCKIKDRKQSMEMTSSFEVTSVANNDTNSQSAMIAHQSIQEYEGPQTCIACHPASAQEMLDSLHMQWSGPTPELSNTNGQSLGKAEGGINTFCTYAPTSKGACYSCHVRADGNAPHEPEANDVDCLMCHNDTYQRKFVTDPSNPITVTDYLGETRSYVFGEVDAEGNYTTVPDFDKMPAGTTEVSLAQTVHLPTRKSCLRCHATAGGGDWTKRGDMGLSSASPSLEEDVHMSPDTGGANLSCTACHASTGHKIGGRGIDLRQTEAPDPKCSNCHSDSPHNNTVLDRHAKGQVACQTCHIRTFGKGGATELSRDWLEPHWNPAFCAGQGGFVGHEIKQADVKPEYVWFDGTSYVYNVGETIEPDERGVYPMAKANGQAFDGKSKIVPIKRHATVMPLHESGKMIPPVIMWMFMTGDFDLAVQKGMEEHGMSGNYSIVNADAEMLITHGVDPKYKAPTCDECHDFSGRTPESAGMIPFAKLGYHTWPEKVESCTLCHSSESMSWTSMHEKHAEDGDGEGQLACQSCHTTEPVGFVKATSELCSDCHRYKDPSRFSSRQHKKHLEKGLTCTNCHAF